MFLAVDKPSRITSFDVIRIFKRHFPGQKIGHSGTLDPMANGLMILALDKDTKKLTELIGLDKTYTATIDFSKVTDTRDMEYRKEITEYEMVGGKLLVLEGGKVESGRLADYPTIEDIKKNLDLLIPEYNLPLPAFSAKKREGKRSYDAARKGKIISEDKLMRTHGYEILSYEFPLLQIEVNVGSGTYIRSIAYRLGKQLGVGGTLTQLRRMSIGDWDIDTISNREELHNSYKEREEVIPFAQL